MTNQQDFVYVKRLKDGVILDIPRKDLEATLKRGFELVVDTPEEETLLIKHQEEASFIKNPIWMCTLCEKEYKTEKSLENHFTKIHR